MSAVVLGVAVAACGSSSKDSSPATAKGSTKPAPAASSTVVSTRKLPGYGTVLTTRTGKPLYLLSADPASGTKCVDTCAKKWPPLGGNSSTTAAAQAKADLISSFTRPDGTEQVTYNHHALYTFTGDGLAGIGTKALGGTWYLVSPSGKAVESTEAGGY